MPEHQEPENRKIDMGSGNYNEQIGRDYYDNRNYVNNYSSSGEQAKLNPPNNLQFTGSANFVGRSHELILLQEKLLQTGAVPPTAISGMGGVGKTELATQYARNHEADYPGGVCWLDARQGNLLAEIVNFAQLRMNLKVPQQDSHGRRLSLTEQVQWCWQNWQPSEGLILVILDDVTSLEGCREFLPKINRFRVLMTTRLRNLDANIEEISLDVLSPEFALQLLTAISELGEKRLQRELVCAEELCEWLGYLPLGLELVGRYLAKKPPNWTLAHMLARLKAQRLENEAINRDRKYMEKILCTAQLGVLAAFELSWQELDSTTQRVAELLSLFALSFFHWEWVKSTTVLLNCTLTDIDTANEQLYERHLIQWVEEPFGCVKIHSLIRLFLNLKLAAREEGFKLKYVLAASFVAIAKNIPQSPTYEEIRALRDYVPHIIEVAENLIDVVSDENLIWVFVGLGNFYTGQGLYTLAEPWFERCLSVVESRLGKEHPKVGDSKNNLARVYYLQGRYNEASLLYQQALQMSQHQAGAYSNIATSLNNLVSIYKEYRRYSEASLLYLQVLEFRRLQGESHLQIATTLNNLALVYDSQGFYNKAEPLYQQALEIRQHLLGDEHPDVAISLNNLAAFYDSQERYSEASPLYEQALEITQHLLGDEHPDVALILNNLAILYRKQGRYNEAEPLYQQALEMRQHLLGEENPDVVQSLNNLAAFYHSQGHYSKAEPLFEKALEMRRRLLGEENPDVGESLNNLASVYKKQGRYSEAEPLYLKALELWKRLLPAEHPWFTFTRNNLDELYRLQALS